MTRTNSPVADFRGARGSNAGDQFHELWALQRALELLNPSSSLKGITVEGIAVETPTEGEASWDGVDCALYFGGTTLDTADRIEIAQLKYSSANPSGTWTVARLTQSKKTGRNNSPLARLAEAFVAARKAKKPAAELVLRLVSNQSATADVIDLVRAASSNLSTSTEFPVGMRESLKLVGDATGLGEPELREFLHALDLSECGGPSRFELRNSISAFVSQILLDDAGAMVRELMSRMRDLMMPEAARDVILQRTVLGWFDVANPTALFPAPAYFKEVSNPILRQSAQQLRDAITSGRNVICLHGEAGCGKTTTLMQLRQLLPDTAILTLFDCYGGGRYLFSNDRRHLPQHAFVQLINDLSLSVGVPFMMPRRAEGVSLTRFFLDRLSLIASTLEKAKPGTLLIIGIDAADNAVTAAKARNPIEPCFVTEISEADLSVLPANVRIVFSARSGRRGTLGLPAQTEWVPCSAFDLEETKQFSGQAFPNASQDWFEQFHSLSNGVPRVQDYALSAGAGDPGETLNALRPGGKNLPDVLRALFREAINKIGDADLYAVLMPSIAALPAPIPLNHLAAVSGLSVDDIKDFVHDTRPSLRIDDDGLSIADEDVEDFIREEGVDGLLQRQLRACDHLGAVFKSDIYAAINYCDLLAAAGREAEILPIIEESLVPVGIADPIVRSEVQTRRLRLALSACRRANSEVDSTKVLLLSAEASKDQAVLAEILSSHTDLATRFARPSLVRLVLSNPDKRREQGRILVQDALRFARTGNAIQSREQIHFYSEWLRRRARASENDDGNWPVEDTDIAAQIETILLLTDAETAYDHLSTWSPAYVRISVAIELIPRLLRCGKAELVKNALEDRVVPRGWDILLLVPMALAGLAIDSDRLSAALKGLRPKLIPKLPGIGYASQSERWQHDVLDYVVTACEMAYAKALPISVVEHGLSIVAEFSRPYERGSSRFTASALDILLRAWLLHQKINGLPISAETFLDFVDPKPPESKVAPGVKVKKGRNETRQVDRLDGNQRRFVATVFPVYEGRLNALAYAAGHGCVKAEHLAQPGGFGSDIYYVDRDVDGTGIRTTVGESILKLSHLPGASWQALYDHALSLVQTAYQDPFAKRLLPLWRILLLRQETQGLVVKKNHREGRANEAC